MTGQELESLLGDLESHRVERKASLSDADKPRQAICAFANDLDDTRQPGITDYRNPHLAEALRVLGFVQRFGVGIALARREMENNGNPPPEFNVQDGHVHVTVKKPKPR